MNCRTCREDVYVAIGTMTLISDAHRTQVSGGSDNQTIL